MMMYMRMDKVLEYVIQDNLEISYGVYLYHIDAPGIGEHTGKICGDKMMSRSILKLLIMVSLIFAQNNVATTLQLFLKLGQELDP
ncbi:hypothetical protein Ct9H90mP29_07450 [bacterium]|nr:MAG: hypothetical protein Ct9H90mP29_07450 [bacterium]